MGREGGLYTEVKSSSAAHCVPTDEGSLYVRCLISSESEVFAS